MGGLKRAIWRFGMKTGSTISLIGRRSLLSIRVIKVCFFFFFSLFSFRGMIIHFNFLFRFHVTVAPAELEAILLTKEDIIDVGVIGIESIEVTTELQRAYIVSKRTAELLKDKGERKMYEHEVQDRVQRKVARSK